MSGRRKRSRVFWRDQGGAQRAYADFRDYTDVGGRRESLIVPGDELATTDVEVAEVLAAKRLAELNQLRARRQGRAVHGLPRETTLADFAREHLIAKAKAGTTTQGWVAESEHYLRRALSFFGEQRPLDAVTVADARKWSEQLHTQPNGRGGTMSGGTVRHHLNCLSNLFRRAQAEGFVPPGYNPVTALMEKPRAKPQEARWLEVHEAALLLEAARTYRPARGDLAMPFAYPLLATFLLTGGRAREVLGGLGCCHAVGFGCKLFHPAKPGKPVPKPSLGCRISRSGSRGHDRDTSVQFSAQGSAGISGIRSVSGWNACKRGLRPLPELAAFKRRAGFESDDLQRVQRRARAHRRIVVVHPRHRPRHWLLCSGVQALCRQSGIAREKRGWSMIGQSGRDRR